MYPLCYTEDLAKRITELKPYSANLFFALIYK